MTRARTGRRTVVLAVVVVLLGLIGVVAGIVVDRERGPQWSADTGILIRFASPDTVLLTGLSAEVGTEDLVDAAAMAKSQEVLTRAAAKLNRSTTWVDLAKEVTVEPVGSSHIIKVTATATDRVTASKTADAVADAYVETTEDRFKSSMATLETVPRPPDPQRQGGSDVTADVRSRAVILGRDITLAETFRTEQPTQLSPSTKTPLELGIVGLAAGALGAVVLTLLRPRGGRPTATTGASAPLDAWSNGTGPTGNGHRPDDAVDPAVRT